MADTSFLTWPFFEDRHRAAAGELEAIAAREIAPLDKEPEDVDAACAEILGRLAKSRILRFTVPEAQGGATPKLDVRTLCLVREILGRYCPLADFVFAMQGLGSCPMTLFAGPELQEGFLPEVAAGKKVAAFALSEPDAGSDVAAITTSARLDGNDYVIDGTKTWISNGGIADFYTVFVRTGEAPGAKGLSAIVVDANAPGLDVSGRIDMIAPHPIGTLKFKNCRVSRSRLLAAPGDGFKVAMATLDLFRPTVGAAALGFARRAFDEALAHARGRKLFGGTLADLQMTQARLADMALAIDAAALLVYRSAWAKDVCGGRITRESAMAKLFATEAAQRVIDDAVQLFGALGVKADTPAERLYREIRALRIYEGASEVQKLVIARQILDVANT